MFRWHINFLSLITNSHRWSSSNSTFWSPHNSVRNKASTAWLASLLQLSHSNIEVCNGAIDGREVGQQRATGLLPRSPVGGWGLSDQKTESPFLCWPAVKSYSQLLGVHSSLLLCFSTAWLFSSSRPARESPSHSIFHFSNGPVPLRKAQPIRSNHSNVPFD